MQPPPPQLTQHQVRSARLSVPKVRWEALTLVVLACVLSIVYRAGQAATPDSCTYVNAATHVMHGHGYVTSALDGHDQLSALSLFPPLFPLLIAGFGVLGLGRDGALWLVVASSYALYGLASYRVLRGLVPTLDRGGASMLCACLLTSAGVVGAMQMALSDLPAAALMLLGCAELLNVRDRRGVVIAATVLSVAVLVRWASLYMLIAAMVATLAQPGPFKRRVMHALWFPLTTLLWVGPVWVRNWLATRELMGARPHALSSAWQHTQSAFAGVVGALFDANGSWSLSVGVLAPLAVAASAWAALRAHRLGETRALVAWVLVLAYAGLLVLSRSATRYDALSSTRFWLPILPLLLGLVAAPLRDAVLGVQRPRLRAALSVAALALLALITAQSLTRAQHITRHRGFFDADRYDGRAIQAALSLADRNLCVLATHDAFWLYPQVGTRPVRWLTDLPLSTERSRPLCLLIGHDPTFAEYDLAAFRAYADQLVAAGEATVIAGDAVADLWLLQPSR